MSQPTQPGNYAHGYSNYTLATHQRRTAEKDAGFLLPHIKKTDRILDVGCGPGTITTGFAKYVPEGSVVGIDISTAVLDQARSLAAENKVPTKGPGSVTFEQGNVLETLPYPDESFDIVYASQVFGHLRVADQPLTALPLKALAEIRRILKPNGIVATRDAAYHHFYPKELNLDHLWGENQGKAIAKGGPNAGPIGPAMPAIFRKAGFDADGGKVVIGGAAQVLSGLEGRKWLAWRATGQLKEGDPFYEGWLKAGISKEEIEETVAAIQKWAETEDAWFAGFQAEILAWK